MLQCLTLQLEKNIDNNSSSSYNYKEQEKEDEMEGNESPLPDESASMG